MFSIHNVCVRLSFPNFFHKCLRSSTCNIMDCNLVGPWHVSIVPVQTSSLVIFSCALQLNVTILLSVRYTTHIGKALNICNRCTHRRIIYCSVDCPAVKSLKRGAVWVGPGIQLADMRQGFCALVYNVNAKFLSITKRHKHANLSIIDYRTAHPCCAFLRVGISPVFLHVSLVFVCFCFLFSVSKIDGNDNDRLGLTTPDFTNSQWRVRRRR